MTAARRWEMRRDVKRVTCKALRKLIRVHAIEPAQAVLLFPSAGRPSTDSAAAVLDGWRVATARVFKRYHVPPAEINKCLAQVQSKAVRIIDGDVERLSARGCRAAARSAEARCARCAPRDRDVWRWRRRDGLSVDAIVARVAVEYLDLSIGRRRVYQLIAVRADAAKAKRRAKLKRREARRRRARVRRDALAVQLLDRHVGPRRVCTVAAMVGCSPATVRRALKADDERRAARRAAVLADMMARHAERTRPPRRNPAPSLLGLCAMSARATPEALDPVVLYREI